MSNDFLQFSIKRLYLHSLSSYTHAEVAHLVEHDLAKVGVAGSSPVFRSQKVHSKQDGFLFLRAFPQKHLFTLVVKLVDTQDLKSCGQQCPCGFKSRLGYVRADSKESAFFMKDVLHLSIIFSAVESLLSVS